jgi:phosphate:Na+ symporter
MRLSDLIEFAVNIGHACDILERRIVVAAGRQEGELGELDHEAMLRLHAGVSGDLKLAMSTMMSEDPATARELVEAKRAINEAERTATREHLARLGGSNSAALEASSPFLAMLRDLKLVNSHLASIGYAVLAPEDDVLALANVPVADE